MDRVRVPSNPKPTLFQLDPTALKKRKKKKMGEDEQSSVLCLFPIQLVLVHLGDPARVLLFPVLERQQVRPAVLGEKVGGHLVSTELHPSELVDVPGVQVGGSVFVYIYICVNSVYLLFS